MELVLNYTHKIFSLLGFYISHHGNVIYFTQCNILIIYGLFIFLVELDLHFQNTMLFTLRLSVS